MRKFIKDTAETVARALGFPWLSPIKPTRTTETGMFQKTISDVDRVELFERNQVAHAIVADVAADSLVPFECLKPDGSPNLEFNAQAQLIFTMMVRRPLFQALLFLRLYGYSAILIGFQDTQPFSTPPKRGLKIDHLQPLSTNLINQINLKRTSGNNVELPQIITSFELKSGELIHPSRVIYLHTPSLDETSIKGTSCLDPIFDILTILKSMDWGTGQTVWRQGAGLTTIEAPEGSGQEQIDAIDGAVGNINAKTVLTLPHGAHPTTHRPSALDPTKFYSVIHQQLAAGSRIPLSILFGSQRGTLAASEKDRKDYYELLSSIQSNYTEPTLLKLFKLLQASGQLPQGEFIIEFEKPSFVFLEHSQAELNEAQIHQQEALKKVELARAKLFSLQAASEMLAFKEKRERANTKTDSPEDEDEEREEIPKIDYPGLIVLPPHGELIWRGIQKAIVKPVELISHINEPVFLVSNFRCYGIVMLEHAKEIDLEEFRALTPQHLVSEEERLNFWKGKRKLFFHPVRLLTLFQRPRNCSVPPESQNFAQHVEFQERGRGREKDARND